MDNIILKDFEVLACHGVNPEEKVNEQRFVFTAKLGLDVGAAAESDDLSKTVSYADVKKEIKAFCENNCFDLIETLASKLAVRILKRFPIAREIELTVKKPDAPMSGKFDYAAICVRRAWHRVYLALGSNEGDRNAYLDFAISQLRTDDNFANIRESSRMISEPYGGVAQGEFVNSAVECDTVYGKDRLLERIHDIEQKGGRIRKERWGDRTLDIDVIFYDNEVTEDDNLIIPHPDMHNRIFVLKPLCELCPNKVHPLLNKRVRNLFLSLTQNNVGNV